MADYPTHAEVATKIAAAGGSVSDATTTAKGVVQLAGDLAGTATAPTVAKINGAAPATVATSGSYVDLTNKPTIPIVATATSYYASASGSVALAANGSSLIHLDTTEFADDPAMCSLASFTITINKTGLYLITARAYWTDSAVGPRNLYLTSANLGTFVEIGGYNSGATYRSIGAAVHRLTAGDTVQFNGYSGSTAGAISGTSNAKDTGITLTRLAA